jgi:two-component system sensor histidine kinase KdpD
VVIALVGALVLVQAIGGSLHAEDTPGGGLTMVLAVRTAPERRPQQPDAPAAAAW